MNPGRFNPRRAWIAVACIALTGAAVWTTEPLNAADEPAQQAQEPSLQVGTFEAQTVFNQYRGGDDLRQRAQQLQSEAQQAQQAGDQRKMADIQQRAQALRQEQSRIAQRFQTDLRGVMADVAEEAGIEVIAMGVMYTAPSVQTTDVTQTVIEKINTAPQQTVPQQERPNPLRQPGGDR